MAIGTFFRNVWKRKPKEHKEHDKEEMLWLELKVPEDVAPIDKKILNTLAGKADLLTAEAAMEEFLGYGWERIKNEVYAFAMGYKPCIQPYLMRIFQKYPAETSSLLKLCFHDMPSTQRLVYLNVCGKDDPEKTAAEVGKMLPSLDAEERSAAFDVLSLAPCPQGCAFIAEYLGNEDWRWKMKAAHALVKAQAFDYAPAIRAAAETCDDTVKAGLLAMAAEMEERAHG